MKHVLVINGPPRSGKDTAAGFLVNWPGATLMRFADPLKAAVPAMFGTTHEVLEREKDAPSDLLLGMTYRQWQISMSEDWIKPRFGAGWFGEHLARRINACGDQLIVVPDSGFVPEIVALVEGVEPGTRVGLLRIERLGCTFAGDSRDYVQAPAGCDDLGRLANNSSFHLFCRSVRNVVARRWAKGDLMLTSERPDA